MFSVPSSGLETNLRAFPLKHLNIIDPLKETNNLGRSVNRGLAHALSSYFLSSANNCWLLLQVISIEYAVLLNTVLASLGGFFCYLERK